MRCSLVIRVRLRERDEWMILGLRRVWARKMLDTDVFTRKD